MLSQEKNLKFLKYNETQIDQEERMVKLMSDKIKLNRHFKHVRQMNQKWIHLHWSEYFWNTDSGLSEGRDAHVV